LFEPSDAFYRENSFNQSYLTFRMLGFKFGPTGRPPVLPKPVSAYFFPPFFAGGGKWNVATDAGPHLSVEGGQTLVLHAQPRTGGRQADDCTLRFCALSLVSTIDAFPAKLIIAKIAGADASISIISCTTKRPSSSPEKRRAKRS